MWSICSRGIRARDTLPICVCVTLLPTPPLLQPWTLTLEVHPYRKWLQAQIELGQTKTAVYILSARWEKEAWDGLRTKNVPAILLGNAASYIALEMIIDCADWTNSKWWLWEGGALMWREGFHFTGRGDVPQHREYMLRLSTNSVQTWSKRDKSSYNINKFEMSCCEPTAQVKDSEDSVSHPSVHPSHTPDVEKMPMLICVRLCMSDMSCC